MFFFHKLNPFVCHRRESTAFRWWEEPCKSLAIPKDPLVAILEECEDMFSVYVHSSDRNPYTQAHIRSMLDKAWQIQKQNIVPMSYRCCVNTELNNGNLLINGNTKTNYLIDWEKPVYSEPAQDLGHFLAPTTTF